MPGPPGRTEQFLGAGASIVSFMDGSTAFIRTPFNSPLTIANVTRSLDGTRVRCLFLVGVDPTLQPEPYAFLTVLGKLSHAHISITCCHMHTSRSHAPSAVTFTPCKFDLVSNRYPWLRSFSLVHSFSTQLLLCTASSQANPPLCWKEKTSLTPLELIPIQLPPTSPGPEMARSSPVVVG